MNSPGDWGGFMPCLRNSQENDNVETHFKEQVSIAIDAVRGCTPHSGTAPGRFTCCFQPGIAAVAHDKTACKKQQRAFENKPGLNGKTGVGIDALYRKLPQWKENGQTHFDVQ